MDTLKTVTLSIIFLPLLSALLAGLWGKLLGRSLTHWLCCIAVAGSFFLTVYLFYQLTYMGHPSFEWIFYQWANIGGISFHIGFMVDSLTVFMMLLVTFVSWMVHVYTIGYMHDDAGYQRFFSYIALFTFAMLMLVSADNFLQLFFGWEAVGLVSYLLIGFWYQKDTAIFANLKAFLVNRVGDLGFLLGIAAVLMFFGTLSYTEVFAQIDDIVSGALPNTIEIFSGHTWSALTVMGILLFIGAMGKSAQMPLHVWLPDSMEGPTPISALIHAATMVTAGVFMVARLSPIYEQTEVASSFILVIGGSTAFFMGILGIVQNDIKRVIAYSTLSQLGYMMTAMGVSAYAAGMFHLFTHGFFKALLFLGAGSVIIGMHHIQDIRQMGGLKKYMPVTYITFVVGTLALTGFPPFSGFYSKDMIIEAVGLSTIPGATYAYWCVLGGVLITAIYSFRVMFLVFHGKERMDDKTRSHLKESPSVVTVPLIALAVPSLIIGALIIKPLLFAEPGYFAGSIFVLPDNDVLAQLGHHFHGSMALALHGVVTLPFWLVVLGFVICWYMYMKRPELPEKVVQKIKPLYNIFMAKYGFDQFNQRFIAGGIRCLGAVLWRYGDEKIIDGVAVNGTAKTVGWFARVVRHIQTGYLYHYAIVMILGTLVLMGWLIWFKS